MKRIVIAAVVLLAVSTPLWATMPNQTCQIGQCGAYVCLGACVQGPCPTPCPNPCTPCGGCQGGASVVMMSSCQMMGSCGGYVGMHAQCVITSHVCGVPNPCNPGPWACNMPILNWNGATLSICLP